MLQKIGQAMGVGIPGEASTAAAGAGASREVAAPEEEDANDEEEESLVHQAASVGDAEVTLLICFIFLYALQVSWLVLSRQHLEIGL